MSNEPHTAPDAANPYAAPLTHSDTVEESTALARTQRNKARRWIAFFGVVALAIGIVSRLVRPMIDGPIHYESIVSGLLLIALCFVLLGLLKSFPFQRALVGLLIGLFAIWCGYFCGWTAVHGSVWDDLIAVAAMMWLVSSLTGSVILYIHKSRTARQKRTPARF